MESFRDVIDRWPELKDFASDLGVKYVNAQVMRHRNSIPSDYWESVVQAAHARKIPGISYEILARLRAKKPLRRRQPKRRAEARASA